MQTGPAKNTHTSTSTIKEKQLRTGRGFKKLEWRLEKLPEDVYLSFDLDVMPKRIMFTAYDQGTLKTRELMKLISMIKETKRIIGADIIWYADTENK